MFVINLNFFLLICTVNQEDNPQQQCFGSAHVDPNPGFQNMYIRIRIRIQEYEIKKKKLFWFINLHYRYVHRNDAEIR